MPYLSDSIGIEGEIRKRKKFKQCRCGKKLSIYNINNECFSCAEREAIASEDFNFTAYRQRKKIIEGILELKRGG